MNTRRTFLQAVSACAAWLTFGKISNSTTITLKKPYDPEEVDGFVFSCHILNPNSGTSLRIYYRRTDGTVKRIETQRSETSPDLDATTYSYLNSSCQSHRDDGPAFIMLSGNTVVSEIWFQNGEKHRDDGPAAIYGESHFVKQQVWYHRGEIIRREAI